MTKGATEKSLHCPQAHDNWWKGSFKAFHSLQGVIRIILEVISDSLYGLCGWSVYLSLTSPSGPSSQTCSRFCREIGASMACNRQILAPLACGCVSSTLYWGRCGRVVLYLIYFKYLLAASIPDLQHYLVR